MPFRGEGDGMAAKLSYNGNLRVENRNGMIVNAVAWDAKQDGFARASSDSAWITGDPEVDRTQADSQYESRQDRLLPVGRPLTN
jgi:hypothetical protein